MVLSGNLSFTIVYKLHNFVIFFFGMNFLDYTYHFMQVNYHYIEMVCHDDLYFIQKH